MRKLKQAYTRLLRNFSKIKLRLYSRISYISEIWASINWFSSISKLVQLITAVLIMVKLFYEVFQLYQGGGCG